MSSFLIGNNIYKTFIINNKKINIIENLNIEVQKNEFVSIVGPSGCGKSTLLLMVAGLEEITNGTIKICNDIVKKPRTDVGMVFQKYTLFPWLTVSENIGFGLKKSKMRKKEVEKKIFELIKQINLIGFENAYPYQLSGGMQQRVAIARAMALTPKILLMDEPFGALDAQTKIYMHEFLLQIWSNNKTTVLFVTHDVEEALLLSDKIYVMTSCPGSIKSIFNVRNFLHRLKPNDIKVSEYNTINKLKSVILDQLREEIIIK